MERIKIMAGESRSNPDCTCDYVLFCTDDGKEVYIEELIPADTLEHEADYACDRRDALYIKAAEHIPDYVINQRGDVLYYDLIARDMEYDIREDVYDDLARDVSPQEFFMLYCAAYKKAKGEEFFYNGDSPIW